MKRVYLGVAAVFFLATGQAFGEGMAPPGSRIRAPGASVGPNWNGFYVGAGVGAGVASHDLSGEEEKTRCSTARRLHTASGFNHDCGCENENYTVAFKDSDTGGLGFFATVTVGYDRVLRPGWVGGVFADYDFGSSISADVSYPGYSGSLDHRSSWAAGARLGFLVTESTLVYGTAGYTQADFEIGPVGSKSFEGYFVGAGVETYLRENWTLKLEYRYSQFGSETIIDAPKMTADLEPSMHTARLVLSYKLGNRD